jgi:hypothetical protein
MTSPILVEFSKVKKEYPEFMNAYDQTLAEAKRQVTAAWGLSDGGLYPSANQFGVAGIRPRFLQLGTTTGKSESWNRYLATVGWQDVINNNVIEDVYIGILGFVLPNISQRVASIRLEAGKQKFPVINLEGDIDIMSEPAVIFEKGVIVPEEEPVLLRVNAVTKGYNVIKPLGFALAKSKVLISETPS